MFWWCISHLFRELIFSKVSLNLIFRSSCSGAAICSNALELCFPKTPEQYGRCAWSNRVKRVLLCLWRHSRSWIDPSGKSRTIRDLGDDITQFWRKLNFRIAKNCFITLILHLFTQISWMIKKKTCFGGVFLHFFAKLIFQKQCFDTFSWLN